MYEVFVAILLPFELLLLCTQRTAGFDLYMVLDPLISKSQAIVFGNKLIRWINVRERASSFFGALFVAHAHISTDRKQRVILRAPLEIYAYVFFSQKEEERLIMTSSYTF